MAAGERIATHVGSGDWYELSTLARYLEISLEFMRREDLQFTADVSCEIDATAQIIDSVLWRNVRVEAGAKISQCVLSDGVRLPAHTTFERKVIVRAELVVNEEIPEKAARGEVIGENYVVPIE
jgi:NDP-sugar pyrophosphorylase family protein